MIVARLLKRIISIIIKGIIKSTKLIRKASKNPKIITNIRIPSKPLASNMSKSRKASGEMANSESQSKLGLIASP